MAMEAQRVPDVSSVAEVLRQGCADAGLSQMDFWALYRMNRGRIKPSAFLHYLQGASEPKVSDYNTMAATLNAELKRQGKEPWLPLVFRPAPRGSGAGDEAEDDSQWVARELNPEPTDLASVVPITRKSAKKSPPVEQRARPVLASLS